MEELHFKPLLPNFLPEYRWLSDHTSLNLSFLMLKTCSLQLLQGSEMTQEISPSRSPGWGQSWRSECT